MNQSLPTSITIFDHSDYCDCEGEHGLDCVLVVPAVRAICGRCNGDGKHVNPSIDGNGISAQTFHDDPEFASEYFGGMYDVVCEECHGNKIVVVPDWDCMTPEQKKAANDHYDEEAADAAMRAAEMRMCC